MMLSIVFRVLMISIFFHATVSMAFWKDPAERGPYSIGRTTLIFVDEQREDRSLAVDVWYPIADTTAQVPSQYDLIFDSFASEKAVDSTRIFPKEFPLIIFSHGNNSIRFQSIFLSEHLATHGFIVAAPDHAGNTLPDFLNPSPPAFTAEDRPLDVSFVIDQLLASNQDSNNIFFRRIQSKKIAVMGHSFGGFTALALAANYKTNAIDERISAILPLAPARIDLTPEELASIRVPTLILGATSDVTTPVDSNANVIFEGLNHIPRWLINIQEAGHNSFTNVCLFFDILEDEPIPEFIRDILIDQASEACSASLISLEQAQEITAFYATAFFKVFLQKKLSYLSFLTGKVVEAKNLPVDYSFEWF
ncbi:MAG: alpha/beta fold hydrolase [Pseudomonadota bacterium]